MKLAILITMGLFTTTVGAAARTEIPVDRIYAPKGFDDNDMVEIGISGDLPNLCYRGPHAQVSIQGKTIDIKMTAMRFRPAGNRCAQAVIPYLKIVPLGLLEAGTYEIYVNRGASLREQKTKLVVNHARHNSVDDFIYARVQYIDTSTNGRTVFLKGHNPSYCFELDRIEYISNGEDTYSVLPILKKVSASCPRKMVPFTYEWEVPEELNRTPVLLHVRSMDGHAVNQLFGEDID